MRSKRCATRKMRSSTAITRIPNRASSIVTQHCSQARADNSELLEPAGLVSDDFNVGHGTQRLGRLTRDGASSTTILESALNRLVDVNLVHQIFPRSVVWQRLDEFVGFFLEGHAAMIQSMDKLCTAIARGQPCPLELRFTRPLTPDRRTAICTTARNTHRARATPRACLARRFALSSSR